jgi:putative tryptophan/tyrosine transport system substrate-binding protein
MKRREFITLLGGAAAGWPMAARAQQAGKTYKIGYLNAGSEPLATKSLFDTLSELGWIEGKNVAFERRWAENRLDRLTEFAAELVRLNVNVIVAFGTLAPLAAKRATSTIPIVMADAGDPLGSDLVASLARPGGNVTGMSLMAPDLGGKRLELLKEMLPQLARVAVLWNAANPYSALVFKETQAAGLDFGDRSSIPGDARPRRLRWCIRGGETAASSRVDCRRRPSHHYLSEAHCRLRSRRTITLSLRA